MEPEIIAAFIGVGGAVLASVISYRLGKRQNVDQDLLAQRVEVMMAIREKIRELTSALNEIELMQKDADYESRDSALPEFSRKIEQLNDYYKINGPWLTEEARSIVGFSILDGRSLLQALRASSSNPHIGHDGGYTTRTTIRFTANNYRKRFSELDRHVRSVLGTQRTWWQRIFGQ